MNCKSCGTKVEVKGGKSTQYYEPVDKRLIASTYSIPFYCKLCGAIKFQYRAIRGVVFIWPLYKYDKRFENKRSKIIIPESVKRSELSDIGIILSIGPGFHDKKRKDRWREVTGLSVGMKVVYDSTVPWTLDACDDNGKEHLVKICDFTDVLVEIEE